VRIAVGAWLLLIWTLRAPAIALHFSGAGLSIPALTVRPLWFPAFLWAPSIPLTFVFYGFLLFALLCITVGVAMRTSIFITLFCTVIFWNTSLWLFWTSYERIFVFLLAVLLLSGADRTFSLRQRIRKGRWGCAEPVSIFAQRLIAFQITATYVGVGWQKMVLPAWQGGEVMSYSFANRWGTLASRWILAWDIPMPWWDALTLGVVYFELLLPILLWIPRCRKWGILGGAVFHIAIAVLMQIWWFLFLIPAYLVFFEPESVERWYMRRRTSWS
jgi:hypothetical protein